MKTNKNVLILHAGISGISAAKLCLSLNMKVYLYDIKPKEQIPHQVDVVNQCEYINSVSEDMLDNIDLVIVSPSTVHEKLLIRTLLSKGIPIYNELEFGYTYCQNPIIAITGTNGKTTTCKLCNRLLELYDLSSGMFGNMGIGFAENVNHLEKNKYVVLEVSAAHLQYFKKFHPHISVITNIAPEHLDDNDSFESYVGHKKRIYKNQNSSDYCIANFDNEFYQEIVDTCPARIMCFSTKQKVKNGSYVVNNKLFFSSNGNSELVFDNTSRIIRQDYLEHALILICICRILNISFEAIASDLFNGIDFEHRLEYVLTHNQRSFFNDSKATNPYSTIFAINNLPNVILITGSNLQKTCSYEELALQIQEKCKYCILYEQSKNLIINEFRKLGFERYETASDLTDAIHLAYKISEAGDSIIFSPAGNSKPTYNNHSERGRIFKKIVYKMTN